MSERTLPYGQTFVAGKLDLLSNDTTFLEDSSDVVTVVHEDLLRNEGHRLRELLATDHLHGDSHTRRVEKWRLDLERRAGLHNMDYYSFYESAGKNGVKRHDLMELEGDKVGHRQGGAKLSLAIDTNIEDNFEQNIASAIMTRGEWSRLKWATAFTCRYHHPEDIPSTSAILRQGRLLDVDEIFRASQRFDGSEVFRAFEHIFPRLLEERQPDYTVAEIEAIRMHALVVGLSDKLDQLTPTRLSSNRMLTLNKGREMYVKHSDNRNFDPRLEYTQRVANGGQEVSNDHLSRTLFEMRRTEVIKNAPPAIQEIYTKALREKALFLYDAWGEFLEGRFAPFTSIYDEMEQDAIDTILFGLGYKERFREEVLAEPQREDLVRTLLTRSGYNDQVLEDSLRIIRGDKDHVSGILQGRYKLMRQQNLLTDWHKRRIQKLLDFAIHDMNNNSIHDYVGQVEQPYYAYYPIKLKEYLLVR